MVRSEVFRNAVRYLAESRHLRQADIARAANVSNGYVSQWFGEGRVPERAIVLQLCEGLGLDGIARESLLRSAGYAERETAELLPEETPLVMDVARRVARLPEARRSLVLQMVAALEAASGEPRVRRALVAG